MNNLSILTNPKRGYCSEKVLTLIFATIFAGCFVFSILNFPSQALANGFPENCYNPFDLTIPGPSCTVPPEPYCGDGIINGDEDCDEGANNGVECTPDYGSSCTYCSSECTIVELQGPYCGDGIINGEEECEDDEDCHCGRVCSDCSCVPPPQPYCGDGNLDDGEECDDGNNIDGDGCSATCTIEIPEPYCGDGNLDAGEECEVGHECNSPQGYTCNLQTCLCEEEPPQPYCGDGNLDAGEECDDGNNIDGDGCSANCTIEIPEPYCG
ncbi:DUF4215 domain-containing protein, partial [Patescibacteria group bacterium]|nr:DUF4215 domain-containing protein [Patescibacteria group bacterium]